MDRRKYWREYRRRIRIEAIKIITSGKRSKCVKSKEWNCCGDPYDERYLTIDHIEGNGKKHRRSVSYKGTNDHNRDLYLWIRREPEEARRMLQILCMNAQFIKKKENKEK